MTIKRQYSLPKCSLQLEGMSSVEPGSVGSRPLLSVVLQAECYFKDLDLRLSGGRDFLESLATAVSRYSQEVLSGVSQPIATEGNVEGVRLWRGEQPGQHHLSWSPPEGEMVEVQLNTLQLADLVDAIDQFYADSRTLPELTLKLAPVSRRYRQADVPLAVRSQPVLTGVGVLAIAAALLFFIPVPEVKNPKVAYEENIEETIAEDAAEDTTEEPETDDPDMDDPDVDSPDAEDEADEDDSNERDSGDAEDTISADELEDLLASGETITDATEVQFIQQHLYRELSDAWQNRDRLSEDLAYRITATIDGAIVVYEAIEGTSRSADEQTPLPDLKFLPTQAAIANREATVDFKVVFTEDQVLQINPWDGLQGSPTLGDQIRDRGTLRKLQDELRETLVKKWDEDVDTRGNDLIFRVSVAEDGAIADYQAQNNAAYTLEAETPLPKLLKPEAGRQIGSVVPDEPLGQFQVVFKAGGVVEVGPF